MNDNASTIESNKSYSQRLEETITSRHSALASVFSADLFSLTSLMGPISDGPEWPSDASWLTFQRENLTCIISDGLSDPWVERDRPGLGLGLEVLVETPDVPFDPDNPMAVADYWIFPMSAEISHTLASYPRLCEKLLVGEVLSIRFNIEHIKDGRGLVGALLHKLPQSPLNTSVGDISLVAATLLTVDELRWLAGKGKEGRSDLLSKLYEAGIGSTSYVKRGSVLDTQELSPVSETT